MPTLEFYGFSQVERDLLTAKARQLLSDLGFREDIVFINQGPSEVTGWDGSSRPFVRVLTRHQERADLIRTRLNPECDVETILIGFHPRVSK